MLNNLPTNSDSYFYFTQISLEGMLKFLGQWNHDNFDTLQLLQQPQQQLLSPQQQQQRRKNLGNLGGITESISNLVSGANQSSATATATTTTAILDEVSNKISQVADFLTTSNTMDELTSPTTTTLERDDSSTWPPLNELAATAAATPAAVQTSSSSAIIQRAFYRNNLDIASVLRTVLDYYESFFKNPCLQLKLDIIRSMLYLANSLYDSRQQFEALASKLQLNCDWLNAFIQQEIDNLGVSKT